MVRTNQGGSVLSFVIMGVILTGLVIGAAFVVRTQLSQTSSVQPQPVATQPDEEKKQEEAKPEAKPQPEAVTPKPQEKPEEKVVDKAEEKSVEKPAEQTKPEATETAKKDDAVASANTPTPSAALPQTGPIEDAGTVIALLLLSIAIVSYVRSRRVELPL